MDFSEISALMFVFSTVLLFAFIFWLLQRRSIDYISEMSETMRELSEGNFEKKLEIRGNDEFSQMAENLNELGEDMKALLENERMAEKSKSPIVPVAISGSDLLLESAPKKRIRGHKVIIEFGTPIYPADLPPKERKEAYAKFPSIIQAMRDAHKNNI